MCGQLPQTGSVARNSLRSQTSPTCDVNKPCHFWLPKHSPRDCYAFLAKQPGCIWERRHRLACSDRMFASVLRLNLAGCLARCLTTVHQATPPCQTTSPKMRKMHHRRCSEVLVAEALQEAIHARTGKFPPRATSTMDHGERIGRGISVTVVRRRGSRPRPKRQRDHQRM